MPITPSGYVNRPYVRGGNLGEILRLRGRDQADALLRSGEIQSRMWSDLGQQISGGINNYVRERQEAPIRAQEAKARELQLRNAEREGEQAERLTRQDTAFVALLEQQPTPDPKEVMSIYGPQRGMQIAQGLHAFGELQTGAVKDARENAGRLAMGLKSLSPTLQAQFWPAVRQAAIKGGLGSEQDIPEQFTAEFGDAVIGWATGQAPAAPAKKPTREIKVRNADGSESIQIVEDTPGQSFTSAAEKPKNIDDAIMVAFNDGNDDEVKRLLRLKAQTAAATRAPEKPEDPLARRERELRIKKLEADLVAAENAPDNEKLAAALPVFDEITDLSKRIFTTNAGPVTNIVGAWRRGAAAVNLDNDVNEYRSLVRGFTPLMARAVGHAGVLTEQDVERTEMLFGNIGWLGTDNATVAKNKLDRVKRIIAGRGSDTDKAELKREMGWGGSGDREVVYDMNGKPVK